MVDAKSGEAKQTYELHEAPCLDVDWKGDTNVFATSSMDKKIYVCEVGKKAPLKSSKGTRTKSTASSGIPIAPSRRALTITPRKSGP